MKNTIAFILFPCIILYWIGRASAGDITITPVTSTNLLNNIRDLDGTTDTTLITTKSNAIINDLRRNHPDFIWSPQEMENLKTGPAPATEKELNAMTGMLTNYPRGDSLGIFLFSGAKLENPYSISTNTLKAGNSTTDGFVELDLYLREIFRTGGADDRLLSTGGMDPNSENDTHWRFMWPIYSFWGGDPAQKASPDFDLKLGYVFSGTSAPSNYTASTIAQGSDFYFNGSFGAPWFRYDSGTGLKLQSTAEVGGGFTTDKKFLEVHPDLFLGAGLQVAYLGANSASSFGNTYIILRSGYAAVDEPRLISGSTVALDQLGNPEFDLKWSPSVGAQAILKLSSAICVEMGANVYFTKLSSWNISAGVSIDPSTFFKSK
jgi:hypothetical protein